MVNLFNINFVYRETESIQEMVYQLSEGAVISEVDNTVIVRLQDNLREGLSGKTIYSDCRMMACLLNCWFYTRPFFTMMLSTQSMADCLLPEDDTLLYLSLSKQDQLHRQLATELKGAQGQWICRLPESLREEVLGSSHLSMVSDEIPLYIGLNSEGLHVLSLDDWLQYYQTLVHGIVEQYSEGKSNPDIPYLVAAMGILRCIQEKYGGVPCTAYSPHGMKTIEFRTLPNVRS